MRSPFTYQLRVSFDPDAVTIPDIQKTVEKAGVKPVLMEDSAAEREPQTFGGANGTRRLLKKRGRRLGR